MLTNIHPKLPMRNKSITKNFYINKLGFKNIGSSDFQCYLMIQKDNIEIHFFGLRSLNSKKWISILSFRIIK